MLWYILKEIIINGFGHLEKNVTAVVISEASFLAEVSQSAELEGLIQVIRRFTYHDFGSVS